MSKVYTASITDILPDLTKTDILAIKLKHQVARFLYSYRQERNLNQKQMAELLGISQGMVSKWENSSFNFSAETLASVAAALDMDVNIIISTKAERITPTVPYTLQSSTAFVSQGGSNRVVLQAG